MRLPWVSKYRAAQHLRRTRERNHGQRVESLKASLFEVEQQRDEALTEVSRQLDRTLRWSKATRQACDERDEALARAADLERALGQFSAGEAATDDTTDLCDCPVSAVNEHLTGYCGTARLEASKAGILMSTDCTCPPGWKHRAADCPFNPNPDREHRQRHG